MLPLITLGIFALSIIEIDPKIFQIIIKDEDLSDNSFYIDHLVIYNFEKILNSKMRLNNPFSM